MRATTMLSACATIGLLACASENGPTEPEASGALGLADPTLADAVNIWRERGPHPFDTKIGPAIGVLANSGGQSIVYAFGGCDFVESSFGQCTESSINIYNVATDSWTGDNENEVSVWASNGVGAIGGKLYASGGYGYQEAGDKVETSSTWVYDPVTGEATRLAPMPKRTAEGVTGVIGNKLYVLPGNCDSNFWPQAGFCEQEPIRRLYRYDPATNKWGARKSAPHYHRSGAGGVIGGKFYVVGGLDDQSRPTAYLDVYDPSTDSWKTRAPIPTPGAAIGTALDGKLYVVVGTKAYVYDPGTNKWSSIAAPARSHEAVVRVVVNGKAKLLALGGTHDPNYTPNNTEVYTP